MPRDLGLPVVRLGGGNPPSSASASWAWLAQQEGQADSLHVEGEELLSLLQADPDNQALLNRLRVVHTEAAEKIQALAQSSPSRSGVYPEPELEAKPEMETQPELADPGAWAWLAQQEAEANSLHEQQRELLSLLQADPDNSALADRLHAVHTKAAESIISLAQFVHIERGLGSEYP
jgi:hypothetical protein